MRVKRLTKKDIKANKTRKYIVPDLAPEGDPVELSLKMPIYKAQHAYLSDLCRKYEGRLKLAELTGISQNTLYLALAGKSILSLDKAKQIELSLGETKIRYANYLKKEW